MYVKLKCPLCGQHTRSEILHVLNEYADNWLFLAQCEKCFQQIPIAVEKPIDNSPKKVYPQGYTPQGDCSPPHRGENPRLGSIRFSIGLPT